MKDWHFDLALQQELDTLEETFTAWVLESFKTMDTEVTLGDGPEKKEAGLSPHQFTQLLQVAQESDSTPVVVNYLRYQIGRSDKESGWRWQTIGEYIINRLQDDVCRAAHQAADRAAERVGARGGVATPAQRRAAWIAATRLFLAVLRRRFMQRERDFAYQQAH